MRLALEAAKRAARKGEVPVGAVVARAGVPVATAANRTRIPPDPSGHAEIRALRLAARRLGNERLGECDLYVTLEPCAMCAGAIVNARIARLYFGASDPKGGAVIHGARVFDHPQAFHKPQVYGGIGEREAAALLREFFAARR